MTHSPDSLAVEVADSYGRHLTTIDGFLTVEEAVAYWISTRPASAGASITYYTPDSETASGRVATGAELTDPISGTLQIQFLAHPAGWVPGT